MNWKDLFQKWSEQLKSLFAQASELTRSFFQSALQKAKARRPAGIMALPGQTSSLRAGKLSFPVIDWDKIYRQSFLYNSLALVISAYFVADFLVLALTPYFPAPPAPRARSSSMTERKTMDRFNPVIARNLFNERGLIPNADIGDGIDGPPVRTSLPLTLLGLIVVSDPKKSVASVDDKGANQVWAVRPGENMGPNLQIQSIEPDRVIFVNRQERRREFIELPKDLITATRKAAPAKSVGGISISGNRVSIDRAVVDDVMKDFNQVLTQARCVPNFEGGRPSGYRCFQIEPGSIYDKLGMKDNDVICGINGQAVNDPATAFNMLNTIKTARNIELCINRGGQVTNMQYEIN